MAKKYIIQFDAPEDANGSVEIVVKENTLQSDSGSGSSMPTSGPLRKITSPAVLISPPASDSVPTPGPATTPEAAILPPDVQILPTAQSTTGQPSIVHRTPTVSITMTWTEAVTGFGVGGVSARTVGFDATEAQPAVESFMGTDGSTSYTAVIRFPTPGVGVPDRGLVEVRIAAGAARSVATDAQGPPGPRILRLSWNFEGGMDTRKPTLEIFPPVGDPVVAATATIGFLWTQPVGLGDFTGDDVTFTQSVTMADLEPAAYGDIRATENRYFEGTLTLPSSTTTTNVQVTVRANAASNQAGEMGPEMAVTRRFNYRSPATGSLDNAPTGTTMICEHSFSVEDHTWLGGFGADRLRELGLDSPPGGAFYGVSDLTTDGDWLYGVAQIRYQSRTCAGSLDDNKEAAAVLFRVNLSTNACTVIRPYERITEGPRSLTVVDDHLYYFMGSHYAYQHGTGNALNSATMGHLWDYNPSGNTNTDLGIVWRSRFGRDIGVAEEPYFGIHNSTASPLVHDGERFHVVAGYGNTDALQINQNRRYLYIRAEEAPTSPFANRIPVDYPDNFAARYTYLENVGDITRTIRDPNVRELLFGGPSPIVYSTDQNTFLNIAPWSEDIPPDDGNPLWAQQVEISRTIVLPSGKRKVVVRQTEDRVIVRDFFETRDRPYAGRNLHSESFPIGLLAGGLPVKAIGGVGRVGDDSPLITQAQGSNAPSWIDNWHWVSRSNQLEPILDILPTNDTEAWDLLVQLASITHSILLFQEDQVFFKPRLPAQAELSANMTASQTTLSYRNPTREFPASGTAVIDNEIINYMGSSSTQLTNLTRAVNNTVASTHSSGDIVTVVNHVITDDYLITPVDETNVVSDYTNLYNQIEIEYASGEETFFQENESSVTTHGPRRFSINANLLTFHQADWVEHLANQFLTSFQDLHDVISLTLKPTFDMQVGDYIYVKLTRDEIRRVGQIVSIDHDPPNSITIIQIRTITAGCPSSAPVIPRPAPIPTPPPTLHAAPTATIGRFSHIGAGFIRFNVDWSVDVGNSFTNLDVSIASSITGIRVGGITVAHRSGGTRGRSFSVSTRATGSGTATLTATIRAGAIPETGERAASAETSQNIGSITITPPTNLPAPRATIGGLRHIGAGFIRFNVDWDVNVGTAFTNLDISVTSDSSGVRVDDVTVANRSTGTAGEDFVVSTRVTGSGSANLTATIRAGAIPAFGGRPASAETSRVIGTFRA